MSKTNGDGRTVHTLYSKLLGPGAYFAELVWPSLVNGPLGQSNMHSISVQASQEEIKFTTAKEYLGERSVQPKPGFGIGNPNQDSISVSVSEPKLFFP